ncbi:MAG: transcriptional regulator [Rhodospirillaceae bacterium TMED167]|nr:transcriptional regulator [Rhodospirillaceae bacterium]OUW24860.1 MAG: transcriptional regulator [Rhodospirillaceae bacterium TMED167]
MDTPVPIKRVTQRRVPGIPDPVDIHVGGRVRLRRALLGLSQEKLGEAVGLTFQQIQKYERGANRIGASRMYDLSQVLDVPVSFFYDDMPEDVKVRNAVGETGASGDAACDKDLLTRREPLDLVRAYYRVSSLPVRKRVFELVKSLAKVRAEKAQAE